MSAKMKPSREPARKHIDALEKLSETTRRKELFWVKGNREELDIRRIPTKLLFFNIENGRYADKMIQLRQDNPGVYIDPREDRWRNEIFQMLKGEYRGTEGDKQPFQNLRADILAKQQLKPGVVLSDGGVLDGNRRLAVLLDLEKTERNPTRFQYFEGVVLPPGIGAEDRWRIEAGVQIARDEKLPYSPLNQLLKIREGLRLFKGSKNPEQEIANTLYGIPEKDIRKDIRKIGLIDEYLSFIGEKHAYNLVGSALERFEEAVNSLDAARRLSWPPDKLQKLKLTLFAVIRDRTMDNWQMRSIWRAMGASGKGKSARLKNEQALDQLLEIGSNIKELRTTLEAKTDKSKRAKIHEEISQEFVDRMEAHELHSKPVVLAQRAKTALDSLSDALTVKPAKSLAKEWRKLISPLPLLLKEAKQLAAKCEKLVRNALDTQP